MKLNKFVNQNTSLSRRKADNLVLTGHVKVNDKIVRQPYYHLQKNDKVKVNINDQFFTFIFPVENKKYYYAFYKPKGCLITLEKNNTFTTLKDYLISNKIKENVFYVGRLDYNSTGLLLLTNDGELANKISHPRNEITKEYFVKTRNKIPKNIFKKIAKEKIIINNEVFSNPSFKNINYLTSRKMIKTEFSIIIKEGKNRHIHRLFEHFGYQVILIKRIAIGNLYLKDLNLKRGQIKKIDNETINKVFE
ncbi:pseudouridine synthase [Mycoplasma sp. SG1]|uniref:pseudouridine synthase n=1 Tax=Mycoplasma sp. SG1 TaxID=2810348 RepID=UPI0020256CD7|nr:pseudouridine synthase [Mycoplasma sp. SG1]URM53063.1 pseudouridine synthase [Mycoplasma sp. SG1]